MDKKSITETESIAEHFDKYFVQIGPNLAKDIGASTKRFNEYITKHGTTQLEKIISANVFKDVFVSLNINESAGYDDINFNVVKKCLGVLHKTLFHIFIFSLKTGIFPYKLKLLRLHHCLKEVKTVN